MNTEQNAFSMPGNTFDREVELKPLVGLSLLQIKRDATWLQVHFGKGNEFFGDRSETAVVGEKMLEVYHPCAWRISKPGEIITGSGDLDNMESGYYRDLREASSCTRFDLAAFFFQQEIENRYPVVQSIEMDALEGFKMRLSGGYELVVLPADSQSSNDPKYWRVLKPTNEKRNKPRGIRLFVKDHSD